MNSSHITNFQASPSSIKSQIDKSPFFSIFKVKAFVNLANMLASINPEKKSKHLKL